MKQSQTGFSSYHKRYSRSAPGRSFEIQNNGIKEQVQKILNWYYVQHLSILIIISGLFLTL